MKPNKFSCRPSPPRYFIILKFCFVVSALIITWSNPTSANSTPSNPSGKNPYKVLGVSSDASQDDIKKNYRQLCLKFHPDKNVASDDKERKRCEDAFKSIQHANSLIGDEESRRKHDSMSILSRHNGQGVGSPFDHMRQQFNTNNGFNPNAGRYKTRRPAFYMNGVDISHLFQASNVVDPNAPKSVFVEKVTIPLEDLYSGLDRKEFELSNGIFKRYIAAFRGGIAGPIALNGLIAADATAERLAFACFLLPGNVPSWTTTANESKLFVTNQKGLEGGNKAKIC